MTRPGDRHPPESIGRTGSFQRHQPPSVQVSPPPRHVRRPHKRRGRPAALPQARIPAAKASRRSRRSARHRDAIASGSPSGEVSLSRDSASTMTSDLVTSGVMEPNINAAWQDPSTTSGESPDVASNTFRCALGKVAIRRLKRSQLRRTESSSTPSPASHITRLSCCRIRNLRIARFRSVMRPESGATDDKYAAAPSSASYNGSATLLGSKRRAPGRSAKLT